MCPDTLSVASAVPVSRLPPGPYSRPLSESARGANQISARQGSRPPISRSAGGSAGASRADVGVADVLAAVAFGPGLPQSTPARDAGRFGTTPLDQRREPATAKRLPRSPAM